ncbi:multiple epidermal growth factor-like domains protein 10 [Mya arenaria]|uniref:multiple epidermal growth factor-like domains protein 10 n=1 Tax=Mya arenaria TaxID=6604 RepID=UPI0022E023AB|nr:multiple epidermal growth factor-like domains protein 10 [Mya arenaria]
MVNDVCFHIIICILHMMVNMYKPASPTRRYTSCETGQLAPKICTLIGTYCVTCNNNTHCSECRPGYWDIRCGTICSIGCNTTTCSLLDGSCTCEQGFHGSTCQVPCSENCLTDTCGPNGECGCKEGFYGSTCYGTCYDSCEECFDATTCSVCPPGMYGTLCGVSCQCNSRCDIVTGACKEETCPHTCILCVDSDTCRECVHGWFGPKCNYLCSNKCNEGCDQYSGNCNACYQGFFGPQCVNQCINCYDSNCNQAGECLSCYDGKYGSFCNTTCPEDCVGNICNQMDGSCQHQVQSPTNCVTCTDSVTCTECKNSYYGILCTFKCSSTCKGGNCELESGRCENCESTYYGNFCENICSKSCAHSQTESLCDSSGKCNNGCIDGFIGETCTTEAGKQSPVGPEEETGSGSMIVGAVVGALAVFVVVALVVVLVLKKKGIIWKTQKKTYEDISPEQNQDKPYTTLDETNTTSYEILDSEPRSSTRNNGTDDGVYYNDETAYYKNVGGHVQRT